jgi:hypothetical protein
VLAAQRWEDSVDFSGRAVLCRVVLYLFGNRISESGEGVASPVAGTAKSLTISSPRIALVSKRFTGTDLRRDRLPENSPYFALT